MPAIRIAEFDTWREGYGLASVRVLEAGTSELADIFSDEALTIAIDNPITLNERVVEATSFGKFPAPVYCGVPYQLQINTIDHTGITRPALNSLADVDASQALVTVEDGEVARRLEDMLAHAIHVEDFGEFKAFGQVGASATTNAQTITLALGVAGARGGGFVDVPDGTYLFTNFTIPTGVILRGAGRGATILQSTVAGNVVTLGGPRAGMNRLTIDGATLVASSVGVYIENKDQIVLDDVEIKRFETGVLQRGGMLARRRDLYISNCASGYLSTGIEEDGAAVAFGSWEGGKVEICTDIGVEFKHHDLPCHQQRLEGVSFENNTGTALRIVGGRDIVLEGSKFQGNTVNIDILDAAPETPINTVIGIEFDGGSIDGGEINIKGNAESIAFRRMTLDAIEVTLTTPGHNILVEDCREVADVTIAGVPTAWVRRKSFDNGAASGITTGNAATKAWAIALDPGQRVYLEAKVIARGRNTIDDGFYHFSTSARRPGATLNYDSQTVNFTPGEIVTGATSGATARLVAQTDSGATGSLTLQDVVGAFVDNEIVTDPLGGSATVNGALSLSNAALVGSITVIRTPDETDSDFAATFVANGPEIELRVTGDTSKTVEWTADVAVVST